MPLKLGSNTITKALLGATEVQKVYLGLTLLFSYAPESIALTNNVVIDGSPNGTLIGFLSGSTGSYSLSNDAGGRFAIVGNELQAASFDFPSTTYQITVVSGAISTSFDIQVVRATISQAIAASTAMGLSMVGCMDPNSGLSFTGDVVANTALATTWVDRIDSSVSFTSNGSISVVNQTSLIANRCVIGGGASYFEEANNANSHVLPAGFTINGDPGEIDALASNTDTGSTNKSIIAYGGPSANQYRQLGKATVSSSNRARVNIGSATLVDTGSVFQDIAIALQGRFSGGDPPGTTPGEGVVEGWVNGVATTPTSDTGGTLTTYGNATNRGRARIMAMVSTSVTQHWIGAVGPIFRFSGSRTTNQRAFFARVLMAYRDGLDQSASNYTAGTGVEGFGSIWPASGVWPLSGTFGV